MEDDIRRKKDKFERELAFMLDNAADFPEPSPGGIATAVHQQIVNEIQGHAATQMSEGSEGSQFVGNKRDLYDELLATIKRMNRAANVFAGEIPGSDALFRIPRNRSQTNIRTAAFAFYSDSAAPYEAKFIENGLAATFRADLLALITAYDAADQSADTSKIERSEATAGLDDAARRGMKNGDKLDNIVRIKYENNPAKLAAWTVASHLEKAPKAKPPAPPTP